MSGDSRQKTDTETAGPSTRSYDGSRRREQGHERVLAAAARLAKAQSRWTWQDITFRAVADEAGVSERTVYRHFPTQAALHDALMDRLRAEADVSFEGLDASGVAEMARRMFRSLDRYTPHPVDATEHSPTLVAVDRTRREGLLAASDGDRRLAAVLDVLWSVESYERLARAWGMDADHAAEAVGWAIETLQSASVVEHRPTAGG
ncbi:TetR/AcrR family transcriptional regulator [Nocardioides acrostichi]|uniref:TetR/AcrR family transcriptional regulator n=1 Tax=Nocardioides acrostichi TaxID=2784339 RepID=A0A930YCM9_9ACTN|nr:TetR/AcrR family transcriptional regulator [Nocardioides acrostichi]MBF4161619.1 TetR/AcrR family transcriptional regulator [Nocardioides acrostichi]